MSKPAENNDEKPTDNRQRILLAAESLFACQGFSGTSVREIVQGADVTAPVLYYYFGSKEELLRTLISERMEEYLARVRAAISDADSVDALVRSWYTGAMEATSAQTSTLRLVLGAMWGPGVQHLEKVVYGFWQESCDLFAESLKCIDPSVTDERAQFGYMVLGGMMNAFAFPLLRIGASIEVDEVLDALTPRVVAMMCDDGPVPTKTLRALETHMQKIISGEDSLQEDA